MKVNLLSILVPVYNESECIPLLYGKLCEIISTLAQSITRAISACSAQKPLPLFAASRKASATWRGCFLTSDSAKNVFPTSIAGRTKWNYLKLFDLAIKGWTSFSVLPLRIISFIGVLVSFAAFVFLAVVLFKALMFGDPVGGYPSMMSVILFLGGFVLLALGIIGEYLGVIYRETKKRPYYFVNEVVSGKCIENVEEKCVKKG